jgi:hypothetical protein
MLFNIKYDSDDPTETVRKVFKRIKGRLSKVIDLDNEEDPRLKKKVLDVSEAENTSPYVEVCKEVKNRLLILLEVKPSLEYLNKVTKIEGGKCFSVYGSIKFSHQGTFIQVPRQGQPQQPESPRQEEGSNS